MVVPKVLSRHACVLLLFRLLLRTIHVSHRKEGLHVGEFGMMGLANANYWGSAFARSDAADQLPHAALIQAVHEIRGQYPNEPAVAQWCTEHGFMTADGNPVRDESSFFDPRAVHVLCGTVLQQQVQNKVNPTLQRFAEQVATAELQILLHDTLTKAGFDVDPTGRTDDAVDSVDTLTQLDADTATAAARKVSSAHLDTFGAH